MSVLISDLVYHGAANMPEADGALTGGAIDFSKRVEFEGTAISPTSQFQVVSSSASDTATKAQLMYRDSTGLPQTPAAVTLTGQTKVTMTAIAVERLLAGVVTGGTIAGLSDPGGTTAVGDVAIMATTLTISAHTMQAGSAQATTANPPIAKLQAGDGAAVSVGMVLRTTGGTGPNQIRRILAVNPNGLGADVVAVDVNWDTLPDNTTTYEVAHGMVFARGDSNGGVRLSTATQCKAITRMFIGATADVSGGSTRTFYEEFFVNNNNQATALTSASIAIQAIAPSLPGSVALDIALATAANDTNTITNRQTAPSGVTAYTSGSPPQSISVVQNSGALPASAGSGSATGAQKIVARLTVPAGSAAYEGVPTFRTTGSST